MLNLQLCTVIIMTRKQHKKTKMNKKFKKKKKKKKQSCDSRDSNPEHGGQYILQIKIINIYAQVIIR